jgi:hypothetical protein
MVWVGVADHDFLPTIRESDELFTEWLADDADDAVPAAEAHSAVCASLDASQFFRRDAASSCSSVASSSVSSSSDTFSSVEGRPLPAFVRDMSCPSLADTQPPASAVTCIILGSIHTSLSHFQSTQPRHQLVPKKQQQGPIRGARATFGRGMDKLRKAVSERLDHSSNGTKERYESPGSW